MSRPLSIEQFLFREAELCDAADWDAWLALYAEDCEFHVPQWISETEPASDPRTQMSHLYYRSRAGLEDRIFRIRTGRAAAHIPPFRTVHLISNIRAQPDADGAWRARTNWVTHYFRAGSEGCFFGRGDYLLQPAGENWLIRRKQALIINDVISHVLDFYHV